MKKTTRWLLVLFILLASVVRAGAQAGNDFPSFPALPPWGPPTTPTPFAGLGDIKSGWVWYQTTNIPKGWTVEFDVIMQWFPGWVILEPWFSDGSKVEFVGPNEGSIQFGNWCTNCRFKATAGSDFQDFGLHAWAPSRFIETNGAYIQIVNLTPPQQKAPVVDQATKDRHQRFANASKAYGALMTSGTIAAGLRKNPYFAAVLSGMGWINSNLIGPYHQGIAKDPYDPNYASPYYAVLDFDLFSQLDWIQQEVAVNEPWINGMKALNHIYPYLREAEMHVEAYGKAMAVTVDRAESCIVDSAGCENWQREWLIAYMYSAAPWYDQLGNMNGYIAWALEEVVNDNGDGWSDEAATTWSYLRWFQEELYQIASAMREAQ